MISDATAPTLDPALSRPDPLSPEDWFDTLVRPLHAVMHRYLRTRFPTLGDPEDILQEAFLRIYRLHTAGQVIGSVRGLLFCIVRHYALSQLRRRQRAPFHDITAEAAARIPEDRISIPEAANRANERQLLEAAIAALPPRRREVLQLRLSHQLTAREIGFVLGISAGTVSNQLILAIENCRTYFAAHGLPVRGRTRPEPRRSRPLPFASVPAHERSRAVA